MIEGFMSGVSKEIGSGGPPKQGEQQTEYRSEQTERTQEATQRKVVE